MIKVGISGAETPVAGELIRILLHHPDVELVCIASPTKKGQAARSFHHGLIGETELIAQENVELDKINVLFVCQQDESADELLKTALQCEKLRVVDLSRRHLSDYAEWGMEFGLSEINRKPLVRGARSAVVPGPLASSALIALYPLAANGLLPLHAEVTVETDPEILEDAESEKDIIQDRIRMVQPDALGDFDVHCRESKDQRSLRLNVTLPTTMTADDVERAYEGIYDDHNFTFMVSEPQSEREVVGTHKVLISLRKIYDNMLEIDLVSDGRLRGGASEGVHIMNLLFGLHERIGLTLKASEY